MGDLIMKNCSSKLIILNDRLYICDVGSDKFLFLILFGWVNPKTDLLSEYFDKNRVRTKL